MRDRWTRCSLVSVTIREQCDLKKSLWLSRPAVRQWLRIDGKRFIAELPQAWPSEPLANTGVLANFDLTPDGQHVVALMPASPMSDRQAANHVTMVINVFEEMRRRNSSR